jgi:hypothetical protein
MTILAQVASQSFSPQQRDVPFSVAIGATRLRLTLTHPNNWPSGPIVEFSVLWGGAPDGLTTVGGGVMLDKAGVPLVGDVAMTREASKPTGFTNGVARVQVLQTFTSAILVESF